jgi:hypothetical protein
MTKILSCIALMFVLLACSNDKDDPSPSSSIFMKATVDGKTLDVTGQGTSANPQGTSCVFQNSNSTFYLTGNNGIVNISMAIEDFPKTTGTFTIGNVSSGNVGTYIDTTDPANPISYHSSSGMLVITTFDGKTVEGTFSFTASNTSLNKEVSVMNGSFKVPYVEI